MNRRSIAASTALALTLSTALVATAAAPAAAATFDDPVVLETFDGSVSDIVASTLVGDLVYFVRGLNDDWETEEDESRAELWWTDGEQAELIVTLDHIQELTAFQGDLYFAGRDDDGTTVRNGLWRASPDGAELVAPYSIPGFDYPAIDDLVVAGDLLFYLHPLSGAHRILAWDGEDDDELAVFAYAGYMVPVGDGVFVQAQPDPDDPQDLYWVDPSGVRFLADGLSPSSAAELDGQILFTAGPIFGTDSLLLWNGTDEPEVLRDSFSAGLLVDGDRVLVFGWSATRNGVWSWDGTSLEQIGADFDDVYDAVPFGTGYMMYGTAEGSTGFWRLEGDETTFIRGWDGDFPSFVEFGGSIILYGMNGGGLFEWDGTEAEPESLGDAYWVGQVERAPDFLFLVDRRSDTNEIVVAALRQPIPLESISIAPTTAELTAGATQAFTVTGTDVEGGTSDVTSRAALSTDAPNSTIGTGGIGFTAAGEWTVTAEVDGLTATATVTVEPGAVATLEISPSPVEVQSGTTQQFTVTGADEYDNELGDLTGEAEFTTTVAGAEIGEDGAVRFTELGSGSVTATVDGVSASALVTVVPRTIQSLSITPEESEITAGGVQTYTVTGDDSAGDTVDVTDATTFTTDAPGATVSANSVVVTAAGEWTVTASFAGLTATATLTVLPAEVASIVISPSALTLDVGSVQQFSVEGEDEYGNDLGDLTDDAVFTSTVPGAVIEDEWVTFTQVGSGIVEAEVDGLTAEATVTVDRGTIESISITPDAVDLTAGDTQAFTVTGANLDGGTFDVTDEATFTTDALGVTIDGNELTFEAAGDWEITAEVDGVTATATVTVEPGELAELVLEPDPAVVVVGGEQQFTVTGRDAYGNGLGDLTDEAVFTSTVPGAEIGDDGLIAFTELGDGIVEAEVDGVTASADVTVEPGEVEEIRLTLSATSVPVGGSVTATVGGLNENGILIEDLSSIATLESDHDDDIDGMTVTFPSASPHAITATVVLDGATLTDTVIVEVIPAAGPGNPGDDDGGLATSGVDSIGIVAAALALLLAGAGAIVWRRRLTQ